VLCQIHVFISEQKDLLQTLEPFRELQQSVQLHYGQLSHFLELVDKAQQQFLAIFEQAVRFLEQVVDVTISNFYPFFVMVNMLLNTFAAHKRMVSLTVRVCFFAVGFASQKKRDLLL